jgi:hypothetical protein
MKNIFYDLFVTWGGISVLLKKYRAHVVVRTFVKNNGYDGKQHMLLLQIIFYGSSAILIIKKSYVIKL